MDKKGAYLYYEISAFFGFRRNIPPPLGACRIWGGSTAKKPFRPIFPINFVKYIQYSPQMIEKMVFSRDDYHS